jgi:formate hydrogenlyase transcriptional activator
MKDAPDTSSLALTPSLFEKLFEFSPDAIVVTGQDGRITNTNAQVGCLFGFSREELIGQPVEVLVPERFRASHPHRTETYRAQATLRPMGAGLNLFGRRKDGSEFPVDIMLSPVDTPEGKVVLSVIRDISGRKKAEESLRQVEERFHLLVENVRDYAIFMMDASGHVVSWNPGAERLKGYHADEIIGRSFSCFYTPEDIERGIPEESLRLAATRGRSEREGWRVRKDGSRFWANVVITRIQDEKGSLIGFAKVTRDFTERKKAEEALRNSEQQLHALFEFSPDAIIASDHEGRITQVNAQVQRIFGYSREELAGKPVEILVPERFRATHPNHRLAYNTQPSVRPMGVGLELYGLRKDGTEFAVDIMLSPVETADGRVTVSVIRDISERKKTQAALQESEQQLRALFEFSPDAIIASDQEGRITQANAQVERFFGYNKAELLGQSVDVVVPERFRLTHPAHRKDYSERARVRQMGIGLELYGRRKDGSEFPVDIMLGPVETPAGRMVLSVIRDLTERRAAEEALRRSEQEKEYLEEELNTEYRFEDIIGESIGLKRVLKHVETVAATDVTVLILGETGTGKEVIARAIHQLSARNERTLVKLNCAAIPAGLLESELFGHERGAFTGAIDRKIGRLELAHEGTLFLDEIGDLPLELQPKILRALQEKEFERLGSTKTIPLNVRLVAATNRDLAQMVADKEFRSDLYYRLKVFPITLPPLRERREDIPLLVRYFVDKHARRLYRKIETIPTDTMRALTRWDWPGNIRELENFIERAVILTKGPVLRAPLSELEVPQETIPAEDSSLEAKEREHILRVLRETKGKVAGPKGAAARLGLIRTTLNSKMKKLGIERKDYL